MSVLFDEVAKQARRLPTHEKARLARILVGDLDTSHDEDVESLWVAEVERRYQSHLRGELKSHPGDEVMDRVRNLLR